MSLPEVVSAAFRSVVGPVCRALETAPGQQRGERCRKEESDTLRPNNLKTETSRHAPQESANVHVFCALHACPRSHYKVYLTSRWGWLYGTPGGRTLTPFPALRMCAALTHALLACARRMLGHARARALLALRRTGTGMARIPTPPPAQGWDPDHRYATQATG